jgi:OPA family glycerol-3-phosphate transporter-like MFS transporter
MCNIERLVKSAKTGPARQLECGDRSPLSDDETCLAVPKHGPVRALPIAPRPAARNFLLIGVPPRPSAFQLNRSRHPAGRFATQKTLTAASGSVFLRGNRMIPDYFYPITVALCLAAVIAIYFCNNPLKHDRWFVLRRFINWFPLGMTYAFLCMARYNLIVAKGALGSLMANSELGIIFSVGTAVYAVSFLVNGPLIDKKLGGKNAMLISTIGVAAANIALGVLTWGILAKHWKVNLVLSFSLLYALNMYFQSFGSMAIIKVKAYWFHVRERGVFGAIFGALISIGVYFAFDWGGAIIRLTKANATGFLRNTFAANVPALDATWAIFYIPAGILLFWLILDWWFIRDTPEEAGFAYFDTHDASSGQMHVEFSVADLLKRIFTSKLMIMIACVEFAGGIFRYSMLQWYSIFAHDVPQVGAEYFAQNWGWFTCVFGIVGGFSGGLISDKLFQSRRGPPTAFLCGFVLIVATVMAFTMKTQPVIVGCAAVFIVMASIGVTSLMSGTAATDFGGRKATATSMGIINAFAYVGSSLQSFCIGYLIPDKTNDGKIIPGLGLTHSWTWLPVFVIPFAIIGLALTIKLWHDLPEATKRYIAKQKIKDTPILP